MVFGLLRMTPGGLTIYPPLADHSASPSNALARARTMPPRRSSGERLARRNHATSAAAFYLRVQATCGHRFRPTLCYAGQSVLYLGRNARILFPVVRGGDKFFGGFGEAVG